MLISLTRVGAARQAVSKGVVVTGADPRHTGQMLARVPMPAIDGVPVTVVPQERTPGLLQIRTPPTWMGGVRARDEVFTALGQATAQLAEAARAQGARLLPTGVSLGGERPVLGGDLHELQVLDATEQEVLCNALRRCTPVLIALAGRGVIGPGLPHDRVGSRWLLDSTEHLATRYLASTSSRHLEYVRAELRRGGVARLGQMDIAPVINADGSRSVLVRCLDAQTSPAVTRAHTVLLGALAVHARRQVRDGRREGNVRQPLLEENRARAVADGVRASLRVDPRRPDRRPAGERAKDARPAERRRRAIVAARDLLADLRADLVNIDATVEELAPLLLMIDLPGMGVSFRRPDDVVRDWAAGGADTLAARLLAGLCDGAPGGPVLTELRRAHPGKVSLVLESWRATLADTPAPRNRRKAQAPGRGGGDRGRRRPHGGRRQGGGRR